MPSRDRNAEVVQQAVVRFGVRGVLVFPTQVAAPLVAA
jgi:hypothetical protein